MKHLSLARLVFLDVSKASLTDASGVARGDVGRSPTRKWKSIIADCVRVFLT